MNVQKGTGADAFNDATIPFNKLSDTINMVNTFMRVSPLMLLYLAVRASVHRDLWRGIHERFLHQREREPDIAQPEERSGDHA